MNKLLISLLLIGLVGCASTPLYKTYQAEETLIGLNNTIADLINTDVIDESNKPRIIACSITARNLILESRKQIKAGAKFDMSRVLDILKIMEDFLFDNKDRLNECRGAA